MNHRESITAKLSHVARTCRVRDKRTPDETARHRASTRLGRLTEGELAALDRAVAIQLGLPIVG
jgi:hypothetical protein